MILSPNPTSQSCYQSRLHVVSLRRLISVFSTLLHIYNNIVLKFLFQLFINYFELWRGFISKLITSIVKSCHNKTFYGETVTDYAEDGIDLAEK